MIALMTAAALVSVIQLGVLGSWGRTVRLSMLAQGVGIGFLVCGPVAAAAEWIVTRTVTVVSPWKLSDVVNTAAWTYNPLIEELCKIAPLIVMGLWLARRYYQLSWTDHLLMGASLGMGFQLCEGVMRYAGFIPEAAKNPEGFLTVPKSGNSTVVPTLWTSLTSWLPSPVANMAEKSVVFLHNHLVWTALAALGIAWIIRRRGPMRLLGALPVLAATLVHMVANANAGKDIAFAKTWLAKAVTWVDEHNVILLVVILVVLIAADRLIWARIRRQHPSLMLPGESWQGNPSKIIAAAFAALPQSLIIVWNVVRERRAALSALAGGEPADSAGGAAEAIEQLSRAENQSGNQSESQARNQGLRLETARQILPSVNPRGLLSWRLPLWLMAVVPAFLCLVAGGFAKTKGLQETMMNGKAGIALLIIGALAGVVLAVSHMPSMIRRLDALTETCRDESLRLAGRLAMSAAAVTLTGVLLFALLKAGKATDGIIKNSHILQALPSLKIWVGLAVVALAFIPLYWLVLRAPREPVPASGQRGAGEVYLEYTMDGVNMIEEKIDSFAGLMIKLDQIRAETADVFDGVFAVNVTVEGRGSLSVGLDVRSIAVYTSTNYKETLLSLGDESAQGEAVYYFGEYGLMSKKYIIPSTDTLSVLETWVNHGVLSDKIKWTDKEF